MFELFDDDVLDQAMHGPYCSAFASRCEEVEGFSPRNHWGDIYYDIDRRDEPEPLRMIAAYWLGQIREKWGIGVRTVFCNAGIPEKDFGDALYYLFMGGVGHGVGFKDKYDWALDNLAKKDDAHPTLNTFGRVNTRGLHLGDDAVRELAEADAVVWLKECEYALPESE